MDAHDALHDLEQVRAALQPDAAAVRRVVASALSQEPNGSAGWHVLRPAAIALSLAALGMAIYLNRPPRTSGVADVTITGTGSSIVIQRADGQRYLFAGDAQPESTTGSYAIAAHSSGGSK